MWKRRVWAGALVLAGCSSVSPADTTAENREVPTTAPAAMTRAVSPTSQGPDSPESATTTLPPAVEDALAAATCAALETERTPGRVAALDEWDRAARDIPFAERKDPLIEICGVVLENHLEAESLRRRSFTFDTVGYSRGLSGCTSDPATGTLISRNDFNVDVIAIAHGRRDGPDDGWGYAFVPDVARNVEHPVTIPWIEPRRGSACGLWTRPWISDGSAATATVHQPGDAADAALPAGAPPLATAGDDWVEIMTSLLEFQFWLEGNPDPAFVEETEDVRSSAYGEQYAEIEDMARTGWSRRWDGFEVLAATVVAMLDESTALVRYELGPGTVTTFESDEEVRSVVYNRLVEIGVFRRSLVDERWRWLVQSFVIDED